MIENPNDWFYHCAEYAIDNKYPIKYGCAFLINDNAPSSVISDYKKYIKLIKKVFFSSGIGIFEPYIINGEHRFKLIGFPDNLTDFEKEQAFIFKKLISDSYISNEPFI